MRGNNIAIRIPRIKIQNTRSSSPKVFIRGTRENFKSATPKERSIKSKQYFDKIKQFTPIVYDNTAMDSSLLLATNPIELPNSSFLSLNLEKTCNSSNYLNTISTNISQNHLLNRKIKSKQIKIPK